MKINTTFSLMAGLALAATTCGCQSFGTVARGQSPAGEVTPAGHEVNALNHLTPHSPSMIQTAQNHMQDLAGQHNYQTTFYHETVPGGDGVYYGCPSGQCPSGYCPSHGSCPSGFCPSCGSGNGLNWYPKHHGSFSYQVPNDLVYPQQNQPGGAIVYPYYTHRGPSDFFRQ